MIHSEHSPNSAPNVPSLSYIAAPKSKVFHQLINDSSNVFRGKVLVHRRTRRQGVSGKGGNNEVIRQISRRKFLPE